MTEATTKYRDDWLSVIYDATGDYVKSKRAIELAEVNGLFDPVDAHVPAAGTVSREARVAECAKVASIHAFSARQAVRSATGPKQRQRALAAEETALAIEKAILALSPAGQTGTDALKSLNDYHDYHPLEPRSFDKTDEQWKIFETAMMMLGDVPGETLLERLSKLQGWYMDMQIMVGDLKHRLEVAEAVNRLSVTRADGGGAA